MNASPADQRRLVEVAQLDARIRQADSARKNPPQAARVQELLARRQELSQELSTRLGVRDDLRTELSRIESDVAVVDARGPSDARRLIAWVVPREGAEAPGASELRELLRDRLPDPLVPAAFAILDELPLTPGGKVDRRALAEPDEARPDEVPWAEPQSALELYRELAQKKK